VPALAEAPFLDLFDPKFSEDAHAIVDALRAQTSVAQTALGCIVVSREKVHALLSDPRLGTSLTQVIALQGVTSGRLYDLVASSLLALDGADHARIRRLVSRSFTPRAADIHRPVMQQIVDELCDEIAPAGECEFMAAFADRYPIQVICHLLGVPREDHEKFARWGDALTHVLSLELMFHLDEVTDAMAGLEGYMDDLIADRQRHPREDLVSELIAAHDAGDRLNLMELRALIGGLLFAGYDTTRNQLAMAMILFASHLDQWRLLAAEPARASAAVEEVMRVNGVVAVTPRIALEDVTIDGWTIPKGTLVSLDLAAANHDPLVYADPHAFDITVAREAQVTFGGGPHYCLGANLARAEMQVALSTLARRLPDIAIAGEVPWRGFTGIWGPTRLPLRFTPSA